jgi:hypothetical protein
MEKEYKRKDEKMRSNKQKIYVINFKDKNKQIIYKKKNKKTMVMTRDETSFLQEAHIARRVLDTCAQGLTMKHLRRKLSLVDLDHATYVYN